jgi:hypothetical protein
MTQTTTAPITTTKIKDGENTKTIHKINSGRRIIEVNKMNNIQNHFCLNGDDNQTHKQINILWAYICFSKQHTIETDEEKKGLSSSLAELI